MYTAILIGEACESKIGRLLEAGFKPTKWPVFIASRINKNFEKFLNGVNVVILKKSREFVRPSFSEDNIDLGSLVLVTYALPKPSGKVKKTASRMLERSPALRLRKQVYLFPMVKRRIYERYGGRIVSPEMFVRRLTELNAEVNVEYNLVLLYPKDYSRIFVKQIRDRILSQSSKIMIDSKNLMVKMKRNFEDTRILKRISELKKRLETVMSLDDFLRRVYKVNCRRQIEAAYKTFCSCRSHYRKIREERAIP